MSERGLDLDVVRLQNGWLERNRHTRRWIIVAEPEGFSVHEHLIDGVAPPSYYPTKEQAAARLLQIMRIAEPVAPQDWPEDFCIGSIGTVGDV